MVVLVATVTEPAAIVVLGLLLVGVVWLGARHHPTSSVAGLETATATATVADAGPRDEEDAEEDHHDGEQNPATPVVPALVAAETVTIDILARSACATMRKELLILLVS